MRARSACADAPAYGARLDPFRRAIRHLTAEMLYEGTKPRCRSRSRPFTTRCTSSPMSACCASRGRRVEDLFDTNVSDIITFSSRAERRNGRHPDADVGARQAADGACGLEVARVDVVVAVEEERRIFRRRRASAEVLFQERARARKTNEAGAPARALPSILNSSRRASRHCRDRLP